MSASLKQRIIPDVATAALWRVAETDDLAELERILPRVRNVNARNQHGMSALMRAAYHGHDRMVRALLDHGADPNLTRNDKFTALALAAFFGHTKTVSILIEHGAKTEVVTRCGASAQMWATARTFDEVARCLETHTPPGAVVKKLKDLRKPEKVAPCVNTHTPPRQPAVVKTLKNPPEIWDLVQVQEVPKSFNARSAFVSRLSSAKGSFAFRAAAVFLLATACVVGAWVLRRSQARSLPAEVSSSPTETKVVAAGTIENSSNESPVSASVAPEVSELPAADPVRSNHGSRKIRLTPHESRSPSP
ncbi:MAG TPA: ankyrin repeat domain-containing protein, partial [Pyrinomonadaceae bacterium]|nr:ankyrin repeat domain-containing protein [Pyrinomonadaceae bacterium]